MTGWSGGFLRLLWDGWVCTMLDSPYDDVCDYNKLCNGNKWKAVRAYYTGTWSKANNFYKLFFLVIFFWQCR
jgi:hypothetical protein